MVKIENGTNSPASTVSLTLNGNEGDYLATLKALAVSLKNPAADEEDRTVLSNFLVQILPSERQLNLR